MNKPRGDIKGLLLCKENQKIQNRDALLRAVASFQSQRQDERWSYVDVCTCAGLKSSNALRAEWNHEVRKAIDAHNREIAFKREQKRISSTRKPDTRDAQYLQREIGILQSKLAEAQSQVAIFEAEAAWYASELAQVIKQRDRLAKHIQEIRSANISTLIRR